MSRTAQEVPALISAVTEHQRFRQLACYSIECLSKVIDPSNRDYEKNLAIAHSCGAGKCVVDVLKRHPGKEDVLLVCCESLEKLAVDHANSEVIAGEGCVEAILASLEANPEFPEHVLGQALSILDRLCDHKKSLHILVERESIRSLINLLTKGNQKTEVLVSCLKGMSKLTRVHKAGVDFLALEGSPPTVQAMKSLADSVPVVLPDTHEQTALFAGITLFVRLLQLAKKDKNNPDSFKKLAEDVKNAGGLELCLQIMDKCEDEPLSKACSKLLSLLFDSSSIEELIRSMNDGSLSAEMQQHVLRMLASLAIDPASSADIVRFGGVSVLVNKANDLNLSVKLLEMNIKALLYLSSNIKNIPQMVDDNVIETLVRTIMTPLNLQEHETSLQTSREIKAHAINTLRNICVLQENVAQVCEANAVGAMFYCLSDSNLQNDLSISTSAMLFLEMLVNSNHESCDSTRVTVSNGSSNGILLQYVNSADVGIVRQVLTCVFPDNMAICSTALRVLYDLCLSSPAHAETLISTDFVSEVVAIMEAHGKENVVVLHVCLHVLWTLLLTSKVSVATSIESAQKKTGVDVVLSCIGHKIRVEAIRKVGIEVIALLASDVLVRRVVAKLNKITGSTLNVDTVSEVALVALTIGVLAMVPEYLTAIFDLGAVAPMIQLLSNISLIPFQNDVAEEGEVNVYHEALNSLCSALEEIISSADILKVPNLLETIRACVGVLQKHSKLLSVVQSALHLLTAISASPELNHRQLCIDNDILEAIGNILRGNPFSSKIVISVTKIYANFSECDDDLAIVICRRNASKTIISCLEKNLTLLSLDGTTGHTADGSGLANTPHMIAQMIHGFLPILYRLSTILPEGREILRRQGALNCLCDVFERFHLLQNVEGKFRMNRTDIQDWCLKIIRLLLEESDVLETLKRLEKKKDSSRPGLFSLTERSVDHLNSASLDVLRLGLLMLCGQQVVQQIENAGGIVLLYECLYNFSPAVNSAICESSLVSRARDKFINYCIQALGRAALGDMDIEATIAIIPLLVAAAKSNPTVAVFVAMTRLGGLHVTVLEALVNAGAVEACLVICQADVDVYPSELVASAFSCLALLANNESGLALIVQNNAISLITQFISESLNMFEDERELSTGSSSTYLGSVRSALSMLLSLVTRHDITVGGKVNVDVLQVICQLIDVFVMLSAATKAQQVKENATSSFSSSIFMVDLNDNNEDVDCGAGNSSAVSEDDSLVYPDLLAVTMEIVKALISGNLGEEYCTELIRRLAIKKLDSLMTANEDAYLQYAQTAYAMGHLWYDLVVNNKANTSDSTPPPPPPGSVPPPPSLYSQADSRGYVGMMKSREYILRTMNYHTKEMALQKLLASIIGNLGMDGGDSGLMSFITQVQALLGDLTAENLKQLTQLVQLIGNLLLVDDMLSQDVGDALFGMLLNACQLLQDIPEHTSTSSLGTVASKACLTCLNKLLAFDDVAVFTLSEGDLEALICFIQSTLECTETDKATKLYLLYLLREVINKTSGTGNGSFIATVLCLAKDITKTLLALEVDDQTGGRFSRSIVSSTHDTENLKLQQQNSLECLFATVFQQNQVAYLLYSESGYMYVPALCSVVCAPLCQNNPSSPLFWKTILHLLVSDEWVAYFGCPHLLALLAELMSPCDGFSAFRPSGAVRLISSEIMVMLCDGINAGSLTLIEDQTHVDGLIAACAIEIQQLGCSVNPLAVATADEMLFSLLTTLADTPAGARGIAMNATIRSWLMDKLVKSGETASSASGIVTKLLFHEDMEIIDTLVQQKLVKRILMSLRSAGMQDEGLAQNSLYLLRVLADFLTIEALELPKDTISLLGDLIYTYSYNEYLVGVATSLKNDLMGAYAVGPESQLEQLLNNVPAIHLGADGWMQCPDESGNIYYYNSTDGASQWEAPEGYSLLLRTLHEIVELTCSVLKNNLSNVAITEQHMVDFYQILLYQGGDIVMLAGVMQFLHAQASHSGAVTRDLLQVLPDSHVDIIVASLQSQLETLQVPENSDASESILLIEKSFHLMDSLLLLNNFKEKLSGEEYVRLLCEACRKFIAYPIIVNKVLNALGRLLRKSAAMVLIAFKYDFHLITAEIAQYQTQQLPVDGSPNRSDFIAFLSKADANSGKSSLRNSSGGGTRVSVVSAGTTDIGDDDEVETSPFMPTMSLCSLLLSLWSSLLTLNDEEIVSTLSEFCFPSVLKIGQYFLLSTHMVNRHLHVISRFATHQSCLESIVTPATATHLIALITHHIDNISLISSALVLFSDFSAIERDEDDDKNQFSAATVILEAGGFILVNKVIHAHMNKPAVLTMCMEVVFNLVEPGTVSFFSKESDRLSSFFETTFTIVNRYDFDQSLVLNSLQACVQFTTTGIGVRAVFGGESIGRSRLAMLMEVCQAIVEERMKVNEDERVFDGKSEVKSEEDEQEDGTESFGTQDSIVLSTLELVNSVLMHIENIHLFLLGDAAQEGTDSEAVDVVLQILSIFSSKSTIVIECLNFLLAVANVDDNLSRNVGEKGSLLLINMVEMHIENTAIVSMIFQLFGRLVFIKQNLMSFVQHKGIGLLLTAMKVFEDDAELVSSAVTTLGNIVSSDEECSNLVLEAGAESAVEAVQSNTLFQPPSEYSDVHSSARSTLLAISARLRAKERVGTKTSVGTLLSRIGQDVNAVVNSEKDKVKESKLDLHMEDPLLPEYRSALKSGQNITDYVKGSTFSRKLWLTSDCTFIILKEDTNNIKKLGRKIKLQNIAAVQKGYGPGHYKTGILGGKKTKAAQDRCLFLTASDKGSPDDAITIEFANASDCNKWFDVLSALLFASVACPHFLTEL